MPIDSALKRASAATVGTVWNPPSIIPGAGFNQATRQHIGWGYAGILADAAVAAVTIRIPSIVTIATIPSLDAQQWQEGR